MFRPSSILLLFFILVIPGISKASNFVSKGFIVDNSNQRIEGFIQFFRFDATPDKIYFSDNATGKYTPYTPETLKGFGYEDQQFISAFVELETSSASVQTLSDSPEFELKQQRVFLEVLYQGTKNLFVYRFPVSPRKNLYYIGDVNNPLLLKSKFYIFYQDNKKFKSEHSTCLEQLSAYFEPSNHDFQEINYIEYSYKGLAGFFNNFYLKNPDQLTYKTAFRKKESGWFAFAGANLNNYHQFEDAFNRSTFSEKYAPVAGIGYAFTSLNHLWTTNIELYYSGQFTYESYHLEKNNDAYFTEWHENGKCNIVTLAYYFHKPFRIQKNELFVNAGIYSNIGLFSDYTSYKYVRFYDSEETTLTYSKYSDAGFLLGAGFQKGNISTELRYLVGPGLPYSDSNIGQKIQFMVAYHFK